MTPQIWLISNPTKPTHRRLSFKNDMTTLEKGLGWVAELVNGDVVALPVHEAAFFSRHELQANGTHPAPCARFCEANAFRIAERGYQRQICELSKKLAEAKQKRESSP